MNGKTTTTAASLGGAASVIVCFVLSVAGAEVPAEVAAAIGTVSTAGIGFLLPNA
jgi:hypothetical protein